MGVHLKCKQTAAKVPYRAFAKVMFSAIYTFRLFALHNFSLFRFTHAESSTHLDGELFPADLEGEVGVSRVSGRQHVTGRQPAHVHQTVVLAERRAGRGRRALKRLQAHADVGAPPQPRHNRLVLGTDTGLRVRSEYRIPQNTALAENTELYRTRL